MFPNFITWYLHKYRSWGDFLLKDFIYLLSERGEGSEKEKERNISVWGIINCLSQVPQPGTWPQSRHVPSLGIEPATFQFTGRHSIHWAAPARVGIGEIFYRLQNKFWQNIGKNCIITFAPSTLLTGKNGQVYWQNFLCVLFWDFLLPCVQPELWSWLRTWEKPDCCFDCTVCLCWEISYLHTQNPLQPPLTCPLHPVTWREHKNAIFFHWFTI